MNSLAAWFLVLNASSPLGSAYSALGPMTVEQCRAGEKAIASEWVHCRRAVSFDVCPSDDPRAVQLCPVFERN